MGSPSEWKGRQKFRAALEQYYQDHDIHYHQRRKAHEEIARQVGVSTKTFRQWVSGGVRPGYPNLEALSRILKVDLASLDSVTNVTDAESDLVLTVIRTLVSTSDTKARNYLLTRCAIALKELQSVQKK